MIIVDLAILAMIGYAAYKGWRRGVVLVSLELFSFCIATIMALALYHPIAPVIKNLAGITPPLANISAFMIVWTTTELLCGVVVRYLVLPHLRQWHGFTKTQRAGGALFNALKSVILITSGLVIFTALPAPPGIKQPVADSHIARTLLASSIWPQQFLASGLGADLGQSLNFFTVTSQPESDEKVDLGFTATNVKVGEDHEKTMLELTNQDRTAHSLKPLTLSEPARQVARDYSRRMLAEGYFSHRDPDGHSPFDRLHAGGLSFSAAGENLALAPTPQLAEQGLMNSPGHRANILSTKYHKVGIGVIDAGQYGLMITEDFTD